MEHGYGSFEYPQNMERYKKNNYVHLCGGLNIISKIATNRDYDDSVTGYHITHVVKPWLFYTTSA